MPETVSVPKKVFIVGPTESVLTKRGNRHPSLANYLVDNHKVVVYLSSNFYHATKEFFTENEIRVAKKNLRYDLRIFKVIGYQSNVSVKRIINNSFFSLKVFFFLIFNAGKSDTIILPSRPVELIFFVGLLRKLKGCSVILDIQDVWPDALVIKDKTKKKLFEKYCNFYLKPSLKWIDNFIHVAPSFVDWLKRYHPGAKSVFVPLGYDAARWEASSQQKQRALAEPIRLVCVGMLQYQIDIMPVLQALIGRDDYHLTIIGDDGEGERYPEVIDFIRGHSLTNVTMTGKVSPEEMPGYLREMDIGIVPMISSSIPNKVFDYVASSLPILVLGDNDSADFVRAEKIGWSVTYDAKGVSSFLDELSLNEYQNKVTNIVDIREPYERKTLFSHILNMVNS